MPAIGRCTTRGVTGRGIDMDIAADQLVVRQHQRFTCKLLVDVSIAPDSPSRVALSRSVGTGTGVVSATVVDCSTGGLGIESGVYLPRQARLTLRITPADPAEAPLDLEGTVQRATMISRGPRYYLGVAFKGRNTPSPMVIDRLLASAAKAAVTEGGRA